jgi:putative protease
VVLARELSVAEITRIASATEMPLEVFIHGALCVAYSGQCLTSESLGGRSANRGQCAQACRLPYDLVCDGVDRDLGEVRYLLSPQDLAGYDSIAALVKAGVASLKIEGRLKSPEYVANVTRQYRTAIDAVESGSAVTVSASERQELELSFSRGFSPGWLEGNDHKRLVPGLDSAKRGIEIGRVVDVKRRMICLRPTAPLALGDGLAIRASQRSGVTPQQDQGGRIYVLRDRQGAACKRLEAGALGWIGFGQSEIDWSAVHIDSVVFKNDDPRLNRRLRKTFSGSQPAERRRLDIRVVAITGEPLRLVGRLRDGLEVEVLGKEPLSPAIRQPIEKGVLREKLARLGGTPFVLGDLQATIEGSPMVPMGSLNRLRRDLVDAFMERLETISPRHIDALAGQALLQPIVESRRAETSPSRARLAVLCRELDQVAPACGVADLVYVDFHDIRKYADAVAVARDHGVPIGLASVRMQKPSEMGLLRVLGRHRPDLILARNLAAIAFCEDQSIDCIADFSLNVANHRSAEWVRSLGAQRVTVSYDLNREQVLGLIASLPSNWLEVVIHQHMPMFHMEHCVFCSVLSPGTDKSNCGRPCDRHDVKLRDRVGAEHPLHADVACRNTLFNATPQSGAEIVSDLVDLGVGWLRVELLQEDASQTDLTLQLYGRLLAGEITAREVWQQLRATNRLGVTRGTLETKRNPLAIL